VKKEVVMRKNLDLLDEFLKYAYEHPNVLNEVPPDAQLVILPEHDPELLEENKRLIEVLKGKGENIFVVRLKATKRRVSMGKMAGAKF
jgi:hypothetical protein